MGGSIQAGVSPETVEAIQTSPKFLLVENGDITAYAWVVFADLPIAIRQFFSVNVDPGNLQTLRKGHGKEFMRIR